MSSISLRRLGAVAALLSVALLLNNGQPAAAATGNVYVRGTITCPEGQAFAGAWVNSSAGKSNWASKSIRVGTSNRMADLSLTLTSVTLPTTVSLNVGCGVNSSGGWRYVYNGVGTVKATGTGTVFINAGCSTTSCTGAPRGNSDSRTSNGFATDQCTWRAAEFWKQMTGSYTPWRTSAGRYGDAHVWDDLAPSTGWAVRGWAEPDSLMVTQPTATNPYGHVGYVAQVRSYNGKVEVLFYDRNARNDGKDRNGEWILVPSGAKFIRVPPRFTGYNR